MRGCLVRAVVVAVCLAALYLIAAKPQQAQSLFENLFQNAWVAVPLMLLTGLGLIGLGFSALTGSAACDVCRGTGKGNHPATDRHGNTIYVCWKCGGESRREQDSHGNLLGCVVTCFIGFILVVYALSKVGDAWKGAPMMQNRNVDQRQPAEE